MDSFHLKSIFKQANNDKEDSPIPTCCTFASYDLDKLLVGFNDASLSVVDLNNFTFKSNIKIFNNKQERVDLRLFQPNCIFSSSSVPIIYIGCEDGTIKSIDMRTGKFNGIFNFNTFIIIIIKYRKHYL